MAGPILKYLVSLRQLGSHQRSRLQAINSRMVAYYDDNPGSPRMPAIRMSNLEDYQGWVVLHGPVVKAANTRNLNPFILILREEFF